MFLNKNVLFVLLILVTITTTSVFGGKKQKEKVTYVNVEDYHTCLPLLMRPQHTAAVPSQSIQLFGETFTATRHHVIPYSILATFFNLVLREDPVSELGAYLATRVRDIWDFFRENDGAGAYPPGREPRLLPCGRTITFEGRSATFSVDYRMLAAFTWMPGNIFYGPPPKRRANDPIEKFEEDAEQIVGSQAFAVLRRIYTNMQNYINNISERTTRNFDAILNDLSVVAETNTPYEFHQADWVVADWDEAGNKLFGIKKRTEVIKEVTHENDHKITKRWATGVVGMCEDYLKAADRVCEEYTSHLVPKFNTNFTHVNIDSDKLPLFVYSINNKHFVYGQNKWTNGWSIHSVKQNGMVGVVVDQGSWLNYYAVQFPFEIDGKYYFYGHNLETNYWFIHELDAGGTIGRETDNGHFKYNYQTQFYIYINGQHYLYGQNDYYKNWFLQILNSDGTMGREVSHGEGMNFCDLQFPFKIGDRQYIAGYNTDSRLHYIRRIGANNIESMGKPNLCTTLDHSYSVLFPVSLGGKTYLFGHAPDSKYWAVRQVFGDVVEQNFINYEFTNAKPFNINGYQYFYAIHKGDSHWSLHYFDYKYLEENLDI